MKQFDADKDYDDFDAWFQKLSDERFAGLALIWMESMKAGTVLQRAGDDVFKGWAYDNRWPEIRAARECDRLSHLSDMAAMARRAA